MMYALCFVNQKVSYLSGSVHLPQLHTKLINFKRLNRQNWWDEKTWIQGAVLAVTLLLLGDLWRVIDLVEAQFDIQWNDNAYST